VTIATETQRLREKTQRLTSFCHRDHRAHRERLELIVFDFLGDLGALCGEKKFLLFLW